MLTVAHALSKVFDAMDLADLFLKLLQYSVMALDSGCVNLKLLGVEQIDRILQLDYLDPETETTALQELFKAIEVDIFKSIG